MQAERQPDYSLLYSLQGFLYCDLLLAEAERAAWQVILQCGGKRQRDAALASPAHELTPIKAPSALRSAGAFQSCRTVTRRAAQTLGWAEQNNVSILDIAFNHLTLGRTGLYKAILEHSEFRLLTSDFSHIDAAVSGFRRSGQQNYLPRGLLTRAWMRSLTGARTGPESAQSDLNEAWEIAERGPMRLFLADIHLHRARLFGLRISDFGLRNEEAEGGVRNEAAEPYPWESPQSDLAAAEKLINACGYHRRDEELADAKEAILGQGLK